MSSSPYQMMSFKRILVMITRGIQNGPTTTGVTVKYLKDSVICPTSLKLQ